MKKFISTIIVIAVAAIGFYFLSKLGDGEKIEGINFEQEKPVAADEGDNQAKPDQELKIMAQIVREGSGEAAKNGDKITVHYTGYFEDGTKFDSSVDRGQPFSFDLGVGQVIPGWDLGVVGMKVGEVRKLVIPPQFAYGEQGVPGAIPPNAVLIFEIELLGIN